MCRLAAFPPGFPREVAVNVLKHFAEGNEDGTGYAYVQDGRFVTKRWPTSLKKVLRREREAFLSHMPYAAGWTVAHLRAASHGSVRVANTHPFIKGDNCVVHNGIWSEYDIARSALGGLVKFSGETDSEVAAYLINKLGPKQAYDILNRGGVFLSLQTSGDLWILKTSGSLDSIKTRHGTLYASELPTKLDYQIVDDGWIHLSADGSIIKRRRATYEYLGSYKGWGKGYGRGSGKGGYSGYDDGYGTTHDEWGDYDKKKDKRDVPVDPVVA